MQKINLGGRGNDAAARQGGTALDKRSVLMAVPMRMNLAGNKSSLECALF